MESINQCRRNALRQLSLATAGLVAACSRVPLAQQTYQAFTTKLPGPDEYPVSAEKVAASPYASLGAQFEGQPKVVMTLATVEGQQLNWVSSNHLLLATRQELLVSTKGLPFDLIDIEENQPSPVSTLLPGQQSARGIYRSQRIVDANRQEHLVEVTSRYRNLGERDISTLGTTRTTWLIEEEADYKIWRWETVNRYWIDPTSRFAWRTHQRFTPEINTVELNVLKPYA